MNAITSTLTTTGAEPSPVANEASRRLLLIGMPAWDPSKPFHALALVAGLARASGLDVAVADLNIGFHRHVDASDRPLWLEDQNHLWFDDRMPGELWARYEDWILGRLRELVSAGRPDLVAFSVNMSTRYFTLRAARWCRKNLPGVPILFGGVDCFPGEQGHRFLGPNGTGACDIICQGESEIALPRFLAEFRATGRWQTGVPGFAWHDGARLVDNGLPELPPLRDELPQPAYDLFDLSAYTAPGSLPFFFTRGCIYNCLFCSEKPNFRRFRCRDAAEAFRELQHILPQARAHTPVPTLNFSDSNFNANMPELRRFVRMILDSGEDFRWGGQAHIHPLFTDELLAQMAKSGLVSIFWGIETGSQHVVDLMNKRYKQTDARRILDECSRLGIHQRIPIILGFPGETPEDIVDTLAFILEYQDKPGCHIQLPCQIVVRPNSPLHTEYEKYGLANNRYYDWETADGTNTLPVRIARRYVVRQAHGNRDLSMEGLVDTEEIRNVRLDQAVVARDLFGVLHEASRRAGELDRFYRRIENWPGTLGLPTRASCDGDRRDAAFARWCRAEKDTPRARGHIARIVLETLLALRRSVRGCESAASVA